MTITFVIPFLNVTGGIRIVLEYANALHDAGHSVHVVYPVWPYRFHFTRRQQFGEFRRQLAGPDGVSWFPLRAKLVRVPLVTTAVLPAADVVIATSWPTAFDVARLAPSRGRKVHLVMHHEGDTGPPRRVPRVYGLPMFRITISERVREEIEQRFRCEVHAVVSCGVDPRVFFPDGDRDEASILMLYHPEPRKGAADGLAALTRLRERCPGLRVRLCGVLKPDLLPDGMSFAWRPDDAALRRLYSRGTALLYPSRYEGFGLPPLEAMACGCPVVATRVGAIPEFARDRHNALLVDPEDRAAMTDRIEELVRKPGLRAALSTAGLRTAREYSTSRAGASFEAALMRSLDEP